MLSNKMIFHPHLVKDALDLDSIEDNELFAERRIVATIYLNMDKFSRKIQQLDEQTAVKIVYGFFNYISDVTSQHRGMILEFQGDSVLIVFGAPISNIEIVNQAITCAFELFEKGKQFIKNHAGELNGDFPLKIWIIMEKRLS